MRCWKFWSSGDSNAPSICKPPRYPPPPPPARPRETKGRFVLPGGGEFDHLQFYRKICWSFCAFSKPVSRPLSQSALSAMSDDSASVGQFAEHDASSCLYSLDVVSSLFLWYHSTNPPDEERFLYRIDFQKWQTVILPICHSICTKALVTYCLWYFCSFFSLDFSGYSASCPQKSCLHGGWERQAWISSSSNYATQLSRSATASSRSRTSVRISAECVLVY